MKIEKLILKDGIIQNKFINGKPVKHAIIEPYGKRNVRTLKPLRSEDGCTYHNTGNESPKAGDEMHAKYFQNLENADRKYVGAHIFVDHDSFTQLCPLNEEMYHAGDGADGPGNSGTFALEICVNKNVREAHSNAKIFLAAYLLAYPDKKIFPHKHWSNKKCPEWIIDNEGIEAFEADVYALVEANRVPVIDPNTAPWAKNEVLWLTDLGVTDGENMLDTCERQEVVTMLGRIMKHMGYVNPYDED